MPGDVPVDWDFYCKMTCAFGSEHGECPCKGPKTCHLQLHPDYKEKRAEAIRRIIRFGQAEKKEMPS